MILEVSRASGLIVFTRTLHLFGSPQRTNSQFKLQAKVSTTYPPKDLDLIRQKLTEFDGLPSFINKRLPKPKKRLIEDAISDLANNDSGSKLIPESVGAYWLGLLKKEVRSWELFSGWSARR